MIYPADSGVPIVKKHQNRNVIQGEPWLFVVLVCFILLAFVSWGKLAHPIFDTGQEAEITARLLAGELIYRDLQNYYGPLPYYMNAFALLLFGHQLEVFYAVGLVLGLAVTLLAYQLALRLTNKPWAALCTICVLIYCAFVPGGLFNLIVPYSYGTLYGTMFCLLAFTAVDRYGHTGKTRWLVTAAIACGLAGLSKQEYGVSGLVGVLVGASLCSPRNLKVGVGRSILIIFVVSICVLIPLTFLAHQVTWETLQTSMVPVSKSQILTKSGVLDASAGKTLDIWRNTFNIFIATSMVIWVALAVAGWLSRREWIRNKRYKILVEAIVSIAFSLLGLVLLRINIWENASKIGLVALLVVCVASIATRWLSRRESIPSSRWVRFAVKWLVVLCFGFLWFLIARRLACCSDVIFHPLGNMAWLLPLLVAWFVLSWRELIQHRHAPLMYALLAFSMLLNARFLFYIGFYGIYAVTALILFFTFLYNLAEKTDLPIWRFLLICLLIGGGMNLVELGQYRYAVRSPQGTIYTKYADLAVAFNQTIKYINASKAKSVLLVPAGASLNFLTRTHSPSQETIFLPGIVPTPDAEREFIDRMKNKPPELIVYVDVPFWWLQPGYQTYAEFNPLIDQWITKEHQLVYSSPQILGFGNGKEWTINIYASK
ncbi:glycosyltransferase family 39 protein [Scytonema hofmannii FACHB-248]|uniref:Glycosyltransferase family 39 protein n=1 Tax=Scytonema hofmannii FACHB-248 TaxID=1842502 RepID=A0ABR8GUR4_9CYAN|nr:MULTISPECIES: glycosyltransferase family 39 protein [Nostocales]MBD2606893.1 glycosyltransferase family 39 protein [Scytonema hofmannii FACHB-248]